MNSKTAHHLSRIYPELSADELSVLADRVIGAVGGDALVSIESISTVTTPAQVRLPGADEVMLITYGDTFVDTDGRPHLAAFGEFWQNNLEDVFSTVHLLPFFPSSSDGGFSIVDYRSVAAELGDWDDLRAAVGPRRLMVDLVCNHGSAQSEWFDDFLADRAPGRDYFMTADPDDDLAMVTRPRTHQLLLPVETAGGLRYVWATFSHDQIDFDFSNPDVLVEFCSILGFYLAQGATRVRLDAIAYLWKQAGTTCVHLPQTHQVIKLMRTLVEAVDPAVLLITETNVPHAENVSYFGDGDEAHLVYNFTLAPLIVWSLIRGRADRLTNWLEQLESPPAHCTFLNFIASHDGIGLRPIEGLVPVEELAPLVDAVALAGGHVSNYSTTSGDRPYELNVSLADLLAGSEGVSVSRYITAHAVMLATQGVPAIYVHSMLASPGDAVAVERTGHKRDINRGRMSAEQAKEQISHGWRAHAFASLCHLIETRRRHAAFAPESPQTVHRFDDRIVAIERGSGVDRVLTLHNMSNTPVPISIPTGVGTNDILTGDTVAGQITLAPWQARWLA